MYNVRKTKAQIAIIFFFIIVFTALAVVFSCVKDNSSDTTVSAAVDYNAGCFEIRTSSDLAALGALSSSANDFSGKTVLLLSDVTAPQGTVFSYFNGTFIGNGFKIKGLTSALFGELRENGKAGGFTLTGVNVVSGSAIADFNYGTLSDITLYGNGGNYGVVKNNYGTLSDIVSFLDINGYAAFTYSNRGTIDSCFVSGTMTIPSERTNFGIFAYTQNTGASIINSGFVGKVQTQSGTQVKLYPFGVSIAGVTVIPPATGSGSETGTDGETGTGSDTGTGSGTGGSGEVIIPDASEYPIPVSGSSAVIEISGNIAIDSENRLTIKDSYIYTSFEETVTEVSTVYGTDGTQGTDYSVLNDFVKPTDGFPYQKSLFGFDVDTGEIILSDMNDVNKLTFVVSTSESATGFVAKLGNDIFCNGTVAAIKEYSFGTVKGTVNGGEYVFALADGDPCAGGNITGDYSYFASYEDENFNDGFNQSDEIVSVVSAAPEGDGTAYNPYVITDAATLVGVITDEEKNAAEKYAVVVSDIIVNGPKSGNKTLNVENTEIKLVIDFLGNKLVNAYSAPLGKVTGEIRNLTLLLSPKDKSVTEDKNVTDFSYGLCSSVSGSVKNVTVLTAPKAENVTSVFTSGLTGTLDGTLERCHNGLKAQNAFCNENNGNINNCSSTGEATEFFASGSGSITYSVIGREKTENGYTDGKFVDGNGKTGTGSDNETLKANGFDTDGVFGYPAGEDEESPVIRVKDGRYRISPVGYVTVYKPSEIGYAKLEYNSEGIPTSTIERDLCELTDGISAEFYWTYNGEPLKATGGLKVLNAGEYKVTVRVYGDNYFTEDFGPETITVIKADYSGGIEFSPGNPFGDATHSYTGKEITDEPAPSNETDLTAAGFKVSYVTTLNNTETVVKDCGEYIQTVMAADSLNYNTLTMTRKITVERIGLQLTVGDISVTYGDAVDVSEFTEAQLTVIGTIGEDGTVGEDGMPGDDKNKTVKEVIEESGYVFTDYFSTAYVAGNDVGEYGLTYTLTGTKNYYFTVTEGAITVEPAESGCVFSDGEFTYDKTEKSLAVENAPQGAAVVYENNAHTDAGTYTVKVTVTHKNYVTFTSEAELKINKAVINLSVSDAVKYYGYVFDTKDFSYTHTDPYEGDDYNLITQNVTFDLTLEEGAADLVPGDYRVGITVTGEADNYTFTVYKKGVLTIEKASLTSVYPRENYETPLVTEYDGSKVDTEFSADAFAGMDVIIGYVIKNSENVETENGIVEVGEYIVTATVTPQGDDATKYVETVYTKKVTVTLVKTSITFEKSEYVFTFDGTNHATAENYLYTTTNIPEGSEIKIYFMQGNTRVSEIVHSGNYTVAAEFYGNGNLADARASASVVIEKLPAVLGIEGTYVYSGKTVVPQVTISYDGEITGFLTFEELKFSYTDKNGAQFSSVAEAGQYTVKAVSLNSDYTLISDTFSITVEPLSVTLMQKDIAFEYGTQGQYFSDGTEINVKTNEIDVINYFIEETESYINFTFRLGEKDLPTGTAYFPIGEYTVSDSLIVQPKNYRFTLSEPFIVSVTKRILNVKWTFDGKDVQTNSVSFTYAGKEQSSRIGYRFDGFAAGENESSVNAVTKITRDGNIAELKGAGNYTVTLTLTNAQYYEIQGGAATLTVTVTKAALTSIVILDGEVMQYENLPSPQITISGLRGDDAGKNPYELSGYSFKAVSSYNPLTAAVGGTYKVSGTFTFSDYTIAQENIAPGTYTVVKGYKKYVLPSLAYIYNGSERKIEISDVEEGVVIEYYNNVQTEVGRYDVSARVIYPTGRTEGLTATLTILKATPVIDCPADYGVFTGEYTLTVSALNAKAYLNQNIQNIPGTFTFNGSSKVTRGRNLISVVFTPDDTRNYNSVSFTKNITLYEITSTALKFSHQNYTVDENEKVYLKEPMEITLDKSGFPEVADSVSLYFNGMLVSKATLSRTAKEVIEIRYGTETVYTLNMDVVYGEQTAEEETIEVSPKLLDTQNLTFSSDGETIYLVGETGYISMKEKYKDKFALYVNGGIVAGTYAVTPSMKEITISIRSKTLGVSLYTQITAVTTEENPETQPPSTGETAGETEFKTYYYYIIAAAGVIVIIGVVLLILKLKR